MVEAGHGRGMTSVNQTRPHCVNQMGKTHCKPLATRHGRGKAWARHAMCESAFRHLGYSATSGHLDSTPEKRGCVSNHVEDWPIVFEVWNLRVQKNCFQFVLVARHQTRLSLLNSEIIRSDTEYRKRFMEEISIKGRTHTLDLYHNFARVGE